jgi:ribosomal protein S18 acetylase RimI-like enzyme
LHDPTVNGFIAEVEGAPVGYVKTKLNTEEKRYYVSSIYLLPEAQGKGIGRKLMLMAAEESEANGFDRVYLGVMVKNRPALDWYSKMGFQRVETAPFTMGTTSVDHFIGYIPLTSLRAYAR